MSEELELPLTPEEENKLYKQDGIVGIYFAINRKLNEISGALNDRKLTLEGDDKIFERFMKLAVDNRDIVENLLYIENKLKERFSVDDVEATKTANTPLIERVVKAKLK